MPSRLNVERMSRPETLSVVVEDGCPVQPYRGWGAPYCWYTARPLLASGCIHPTTASTVTTDAAMASRTGTPERASPARDTFETTEVRAGRSTSTTRAARRTSTTRPRMLHVSASHGGQRFGSVTCREIHCGSMRYAVINSVAASATTRSSATVLRVRVAELRGADIE